MAPNQLLKLLKPLHGLKNAVEYLQTPLPRHLRQDRNMATTTGDFRLFTRDIREIFSGFSGAYIDDTLSTGDKDFEELCGMTERMVQSSPMSYEEITFGGIQITKSGDGSLIYQRR